MLEQHIDPARVIGYQFPTYETTHSAREVSLYALGIGAASDPTDQDELRFVYELHQEGFCVLPTFSTTLPFPLLTQLLEVPGLQIDPFRLLHGEHTLISHQPFPAEATLIHHACISQVYDKGKGALLLLDVETRTDTDDVLCLNQYRVFLRGLGGFGGERGPGSDVHQPPDREPDARYQQTTLPQQALLYRLAGDRNPLHADPVFAMLGGYERPILHGLATFGFAARAALKFGARNDPARLKQIEARFRRHVFPGETLETTLWRLSETQLILEMRVVERDEIVLSNAAVTLG